MRTVKTAFALVATVIGAGFASGQEIMAFFTRFGPWGAVGIGLAGVVMALCAWGLMALAHRYKATSLDTLCGDVLGKLGRRACQGLYGLMLVLTGGAMLGAAGELVALMLPYHQAYALGFLATLLLGLWFSLKGLGPLSAMGILLVPLIILLCVLVLRLPDPGPSVVTRQPNAWLVAPLALSYAAMNIVLPANLLCESASALSTQERRRAALLGAGALMVLLAAMHGAMLPYRGQLANAALPMVRLCSALGKTGFWLCALCLLLAVLSTLSAILRAGASLVPLAPGLKAPAMGVLCAASGLWGLSGVVGVGYPLLGWGCAMLVMFLLVKALFSGGFQRAKKG